MSRDTSSMLPLSAYRGISSSGVERKHIHFSYQVEQCIAVEVKDDDDDDDCDISTDTNSEDGMIMKLDRSRKPAKEDNSVLSDGKTIAMLPSTTLKHREHVQVPETVIRYTSSALHSHRVSPFSPQEASRPPKVSGRFSEDLIDADTNSGWYTSKVANHSTESTGGGSGRYLRYRESARLSYGQDRNINWDPKRHRIRCILHVINLSLQAFLFASSREALQAALDAASDITGDEHYEPFNFILNDASGGDTTNQPDHMEAQTEHPGGVACKRTSIQKVNPPLRPDNKSDNTRRGGWVMVPALRKLHRIGLWLRNSPIHSDAWDERIKLRLGKKQQVKQFLLDYDKALGDNILTSSDWDYLEKTHAFLQPFTSTTLWAQGVTATLSQNLMIMDILLCHYEQKKELYEAEETHDPLMLHSIDMGWFVLDKYYALSGESPIYATALLLDPSKRARYLDINWKGDWAEAAIRDALSIWRKNTRWCPPSDLPKR
ncbi:hypothetical protein FOXG_22546 [Fusarium oxysporum f. sp. lycopersici 4287]|uniref:Uncharacterized protein n=1 Tax=Fusarium oxysporum f. sp. lycopersici (strain 4287 / CBS 123668 / FGSC 9935 / NRRL 34936) TaxID=426428 RepID=A0A0J9W838_FUSO4|nr:hypothetical protein FOXG_22546 [Fusarium oxysporum f. sp. lycopersici 4287]KNB19379.1 hypothetical protein FOXG_22546 [Fusarium oxysporum f. sp. lycopersici 4287]